jgi:hypothetical protein
LRARTAITSRDRAFGIARFRRRPISWVEYSTADDAAISPIHHVFDNGPDLRDIVAPVTET